MGVEHYIAELLYRYNCVVVPDFGAFLANTFSARIASKENTLYPPSKTLSFNQSLIHNDGLLVSHMANTKKLPYDTLLEQVLQETKHWREKLENGESLFLEGIGKLWMGKERKILFTPENTINYLASSFGLSAFPVASISRETLKEEVQVLEERVPFLITPEKRNTPGLRPFLKYAAILLLALSTGISGYQLYRQQQKRKQVVAEEAQQQVSRYLQEATFFESSPLELPALQLDISKRATYPRHHIIAGAYRIQQNADKKIASLKKQGYQARYLGTNAYGLHQVAYATLYDREEALQFLRQIKRTVSQDAWMLSERKK